MSNFSDLGKIELYALLKEKNVKGISKMTKQQMIEALVNSEKVDETIKPVEIQEVPRPQPPTVQQTLTDPSNMTTKQLRELLKQRGCKGKLSDTNKTDLLRMLRGETPLPERKAGCETFWNKALSEFNKGRPHYLMPKKGTEEYEQVLKIKMRLENEQLKKKVSKA